MREAWDICEEFSELFFFMFKFLCAELFQTYINLLQIFDYFWMVICLHIFTC